MTTLRRTTRWAWPTRPRPDASLRAAAQSFLLRVGIYGALGLATWAHWWQAVRS